MIRLHRPVLPALVLALLAPLTARGQAPGMPAGGPQQGEEQKPEGAAEKAPREAGQAPTVPILPPWQGSKRKRFQLLQMDGYLRTRVNWLSNFHMGFTDTEEGMPFRAPISCFSDSEAETACKGSIGTSDLRLRLEPRISVTEDVVVRAQVDVLDNLVLGATPNGLVLDGTSAIMDMPTSAFSDSQVDADGERNWYTDSIRVKRAWAEVMTPLGLLRFGRMPVHWGLGMLQNSGSDDPFTGSYCLDCDDGDSADRIEFGTQIPGTRFKAAIALDWVASGVTAGQSSIFANRYRGQPWDLDDSDDVSQWVFVLGDLDSPADFQEKVNRGELALNYGLQVLYRHQSWSMTTWTLGATPESLATTFQPRDATFYVPDVYARVSWGKLSLAGEFAAVLGKINSLEDITEGLTDVTVREFGAVARANYLMLGDDLNLGIELGYASGDQWDADPQGSLDVNDVPIVPTDATNDEITRFIFSEDFIVDQILFRRLMKAVSNAAYARPNLTYTLSDRFVFKAQSVVSFAPEAVATPGNEHMYGIELDGDVGYQNVSEGFFAGLSYGVLFPLGALNHPSELGFTDDDVDAGTAQTFQCRLAVKF